ncbi:MAG: PDZ domain-containing protein, partial [Gammaproteobacteria bacterium]|nr:S41 family peptidase [Gemmatimonadota bacterium]NIU76036.1 PDZ domain-containing protein [Gammaproteobacteria bacterium]
RDRMRGAFGGVGVTVWRDAEGRTVLAPHPDGPAERAGVREGDILLAVDGETVTDGTTVDDVRAWLHGEVGTTVTLTISRPPTPSFDLTITRVLDHAPDIGYMRIESFTERTGEETRTALQALQGERVSGLVLDLRGNSGGLIEPAVETASQFLQDGVVLVELRRDDEEQTFPVRDGGVAPEVPLAVLVDGGTASAAEIVAGALQDRERAPLIGEPTFGKGSVQLIYDLSDGSSLHVTSAVWLTPDRHRIQGQGLTPDIASARGDGPQDEQLERAVAYLMRET